MDKDSIKTQMAILVELVRYIHIKQVLSELDPNPRLNFWRLVHGGFLDLSALDWCKIFGSDGEPTHWKGVIDDKGSFRSELFSSLKITKQEWTDYWNHMHDYRNEFVAHTSKETDISTYPNLNLALQSCHFYYDYLFNMLNEGKVEGIESLEVYSKRFREQIVEIANTAIKATSGFNENVY